MKKEDAYIRWFDQIGIDDVPLVGGKNASLGEMYRNLAPKGVNIPNGFVITVNAYHHILDQAGIRKGIEEILSDLDTHNIANLQERGQKVRRLIAEAEFPPDLTEAILVSYRKLLELEGEGGHTIEVAVRSSATAEDLPDASFAGQQETYLNIVGEEEVILATKDCLASLFTDRAISYREDKHFDHFSIGLSVCIQRMVRSDLACSGVAFTIDTETGFRNVVYINASYGLGETIVKGVVNPDGYYVFKPTLNEKYRPIISKILGTKDVKMVYSAEAGATTKTVPVPEEERDKFVLEDDEILTLARWCCIIEDHYSQRAGTYQPMDVEWAKDGLTGTLYIVQARPETVHSQKDMSRLEQYVLEEKGEILAQGSSVGEKIGAGRGNVIMGAEEIGKFKPGEVLVTEITDPDWEPIMKIASAIVTDRGGRTCHAAIVSRELGIPCIVGTKDATEKVKTGENVTVDCSSGEVGNVYKGKLRFRVDNIDLAAIPSTRTKIVMNIGNPEQAFAFSFIPNQGVGLAREEFIIGSWIKIHPLALINYPKLEDKEAVKKIKELTTAYEDKSKYFVDKLAEGIARIAAAFYPKDVIVRMSDFKSNEYANLIGGKEFEPLESNSMIGWRGASRYYDEKFIPAFKLECDAFKKVLEEFGLRNVWIMIPFCRTVEEGKKVLQVMADYGLRRGENGLKIIVMCEIPSNVLQAEEFLDIFDGFSIGSNDLTQLTLGIDRDSEVISHIYDENNPSVRRLIKEVIDIANSKGKYIGICGQGPSDSEEFAAFLVESGIQAMSLNPDTVVKTILRVAEKEKELGIEPPVEEPKPTA
ncbi:MAG: phosphoenolpyruvate synthase [Acidobacteriota bacterium]